MSLVVIVHMSASVSMLQLMEEDRVVFHRK